MVRLERALEAHAGGVEDDELARLDLAHGGRADQVEGAGLRGDHRRAVEVAEDERAHPVGVAEGDDLGGVGDDDREGALEVLHRVGDGLLQRARVAA